MQGIVTKRSKKTGMPAGTLVYVGEKKVDKVSMKLITYSPTEFNERFSDNVDDLIPFSDKGISWLNVSGIHDINIIEKIGKTFGIHPLILEDVLNTHQRPKMEQFDTYDFIVLRLLFYDQKTNRIEPEQVSILLGKNFVITFEEKDNNVFARLIENLKAGRGKIRGLGPDFLAYSIIDMITDNYFEILESIGEEIENLEDSVIKNPVPEVLSKIYNLKQELIFMHKYIWPLRDVIGKMERGDSRFIKKHTQLYLRDIHDHTVQIIDSIETYRDMVSVMIDIYISGVNNKMNEVMKVLSVFAFIFIPLTFLAGVYGMNFDYMPELRWKYGYFVLWAFMLTVIASLFIYFRRKKWI